MDYYGLLFLYYLKGLSGKSILRLFFNIEVGGTEQLLPENTSTPTTTPILADIQYPDGLRTDQYFTYRETPTTVSNKARIKTIKGNTLVWNQLYQNTNIPTSQTKNGVTLTNNNDGSWTLSGTATADTYFYGLNGDITPIVGHKYFLKDCVPSGVNRFYCIFNGAGINALQNNIIVTATSSASGGTAFQISSGATVNVTFRPQIFDLTLMFGSTKAEEIFQMEQTTTGNGLAYFKQFFPLDYYPYDSGSLLSFNGNGIKTVGKNLLNARTTYTNNGITFTNDNGVITINGTATANAYFTTDVNLRNGSYFISAFNDGINTNVHITIRNESGAYPLDIAMSAKNRVASLNNDVNRFLIYVKSGATLNNFVMKPMVSFESPEYFEPYTSSTLSLPISTYFPSGMKSAYNSSDLTDIVRDELSQTKAIKKVKQITYDGSSDESWSIESIPSGSASGQHNLYINVAPAKKLSFAMNNMAVPYALYTQNYIDGKINSYVSNGQNLNFYPGTDITSVADFRTWLSNHPLTVNIALPIDGYEETPITTEDANEALSLLMGKTVSSSNAKQLIGIITKGE